MLRKTTLLTNVPSKLGLGVLSLLLIAVSIFSIAMPVKADRASELSEQIKTLEEESARYQSEAEKMQTEATSLKATIGAINAEKSALQTQLNISQTKHAELVEQIEATEKKIDKNQAALSHSLADMYVQSSISPLEMLASSRSIGDYMDKQSYRTAINEKVADSVKQVKQLKQELDGQKEATEQLIEDQESQKVALAAKETQQARLLEKTRGEEARFQQLSAEAEQKRKEAFAALESLNTSNLSVASTGYVKAGDVIGYVGNTGMSTGPHLHLEARIGGAVTSPANYPWQIPTSGVITQGFGNPSSWYARGYHPGVDYAPGAGTPIRAVADGTLYRGCTDSVLGSGYNNAYGYMAIIEHGNGVQSLYGHMQAGPDGGACNYGYFQF